MRSPRPIADTSAGKSDPTVEIRYCYSGRSSPVCRRAPAIAFPDATPGRSCTSSTGGRDRPIRRCRHAHPLESLSKSSDKNWNPIGKCTNTTKSSCQEYCSRGTSVTPPSLPLEAAPRSSPSRARELESAASHETRARRTGSKLRRPSIHARPGRDTGVLSFTNTSMHVPAFGREDDGIADVLIEVLAVPVCARGSPAPESPTGRRPDTPRMRLR